MLPLTSSSRLCLSLSAVVLSLTACRPDSAELEAVVTCPATGEVVTVDRASGVVGDPVAVGGRPVAIAALADALVVLDGQDAKLQDVFRDPLRKGSGSTPTGASPRAIVTGDPRVFLLAADGESLELYTRPHAGAANGAALGLTLASTLALGDGADAAQLALSADAKTVYVSLRGTNQVAVVDAHDPLHLSIARSYDLSALPLHPISGSSDARPSGLLLDGQILYAALENLGADGTPNGPGMLARIDLDAGTITAIDLGVETCLRPHTVLRVDHKGQDLWVACGGKPDSEGFRATPSYVGSAVVGVKSSATPSAAVEKVFELRPPVCEGGAPCAVEEITRMFAVGSGPHPGIALADAGGRLSLLEVDSESIVEQRTYGTTEGPIQACRVSAEGQARVGGLVGFLMP